MTTHVVPFAVSTVVHRMTRFARGTAAIVACAALVALLSTPLAAQTPTPTDTTPRATPPAPAPPASPTQPTAQGTPAPISGGTKVGSMPEQSPYHDLETPQRVTVYGGYYRASKDVVHATPGNGALVGVRYEVTVGGPAQFYVRASRVWSQRTAYNPTLSTSGRTLGSVSSPLYLADLGFSFDLTGRKSWHSLVPIAGFGIGIANAGGKVSKDPYSFNTQFEASTELGIRYIPNNGLEARFTLGNVFYQTRYPSAYFTKANDGTSVVPQDESKSSFRGSWMFTGGLSFPIFR